MKRPLKKTDKLEVRLPTLTKRAFLARCHVEGRSASETVRGFIDEYLARPFQPQDLKMLAKSPYTYAGLAAAAVAGLFAATSAQPSMAQPDYAGAFRSIDRNNDGRLSPQELGGAGPAPNSPKPSERTGAISFDFVSADTNKDGLVSLAEFTAVNQASILKRFLALDANSDGKIMLTELQRQGALLGETPTPSGNQATGMSISEPARLFAKADQNRDGAVTEQEWWASLRR